MRKAKALWLGETRRLTIRLDSFYRGAQVTCPVQTDYLEHASDDAIVRMLLLPALQALKRDAGIGPKRKKPAKRQIRKRR